MYHGIKQMDDYMDFFENGHFQHETRYRGSMQLNKNPVFLKVRLSVSYIMSS